MAIAAMFVNARLIRSTFEFIGGSISVSSDGYTQVWLQEQSSVGNGSALRTNGTAVSCESASQMCIGLMAHNTLIGASTAPSTAGAFI